MTITEARHRRIRINLIGMSLLMAIVHGVTTRGDGSLMTIIPRAVITGLVFAVVMQIALEIFDPIRSATVDRNSTSAELAQALKEIPWQSDNTGLLSSTQLLGDIHVTRTKDAYILIGSRYRLRKLGLL